MCDTGSVFKAQIQIPSAVYKPQMSSYTLPIRRDFALQILAGKKTFEGRKSANVKHLEEGQVLSFHWYHSTRVQCEVMSVQRFESPHAMVEACGHHALIPSSESAEQCTVSWQLVFCLLLSSFVSFLQTFSSLFFRLKALYCKMYGEDAAMVAIELGNPIMVENVQPKNSRKRPAAAD